ncbi:hypothetical protein [Parahalioglobus pacificus]|uniref:hypothetical protein n=1 Tax=Parahalioglobus pacificus TaxID=930806 RepID=UPI00167A2B88|nr:hypothetical protein [Halioglobus pacificus]NQY01698.1 hypothetical protein [Halieaceae bacterium]
MSWIFQLSPALLKTVAGGEGASVDGAVSAAILMPVGDKSSLFRGWLAIRERLV